MSRRHTGHSPARVAVPKLNGADVELGTLIEGEGHRGFGDCEAAMAVLAEVEGVLQHGGWSTPVDGPGVEAGRSRRASSHGWGRSAGRDTGRYDDYTGYDEWSYDGWGSPGYYARDIGRRFLPANGGCAYCDLTHPEFCTPEVLSAFDHVAVLHAMLRIARDALARANARRDDGHKIHLFANNSDGHGNSWGTHWNFHLSRACYDRIFNTKVHQMLYLASYLVSSIVFTGAGKVGSEAGADVDYQISSRADFFRCLTAERTTFNRPIVNQRDESLCGPSRPSEGEESLDDARARLHVIFFDNTLCHVATLLKVGATQVVLAMLEREVLRPELVFDDPRRALRSFSRDPGLETKARLVSGRELTAVEAQLEICDLARRFVAAGGAADVVPHADVIVDLWQETLEYLRDRRWSKLAGRLDWVMKRCMIERTIARTGLTWQAPEVKLLDHMYASLDPAEGLYWAYEEDVVQKVVPDGLIRRFMTEPPPDTRAWLRAEVLRRVEAEHIVSVDWDEVRFRFPRDDGSRWPLYDYYTLAMHDPLRFTRSRCEHVLKRSRSMREALVALGMRSTTAVGGPRVDTHTGTHVKCLPAPSCYATARGGEGGPPGPRLNDGRSMSVHAEGDHNAISREKTE